MDGSDQRDNALVKLLVDHHADVNADLGAGRGTVLFQAPFHARHSMIDVLLRHGARIDAVDEYGGTALARVAAKGGQGDGGSTAEARRRSVPQG